MLLSTYETSYDRLQIIHQLIDQGYAVIDDLLSNPEDVTQLCTEAQATTATVTITATATATATPTPATPTTPTPTPALLLPTNQSTDIRTDLTHDVDPLDNNVLPCLAKASRTLQFDVGGAVDVFLPQSLYTRERPQFAYYKSDGSFYTRHYDNPRLLKGGTDNLRRLTILLYLNEAWNETENGGELLLHLKTKEDFAVTIAPKLNRCVLFFSDLIEHEVLPSYGPRLALTVWLSELLPDPASGLSQTIDPNSQLVRDFFVKCVENVAKQNT
jgi:Rps23 Pro-64 3,4-dihydroxylase Tpa1-like proline 4-hydroxylase